MPTEEEIMELLETPDYLAGYMDSVRKAKTFAEFKQLSPDVELTEAGFIDLKKKDAPAAYKASLTAASNALSSDPVGVLAAASSPTGGALGQISDLELEQLRAASPTGGALGQIGASSVNPGATRGLPPEVSGINPEEENKRRMMEQLLRNQYGM
jgi:hypothetical protein